MSPFLIMALLWSSKLITRAEAKEQATEIIIAENKGLRESIKGIKENQQDIKEQMIVDQGIIRDNFKTLITLMKEK